MYLADYNTWFDPLYKGFTRSSMAFINNFIGSKIYLNNV